LIAPYAAYLIAEEVHASGVLAVVAAGLFMSPRSSEVFSNRTRIQATAVWDTGIFILNGIIFILIGLELPVVFKTIQQSYSTSTLLWYGSLVSVGTVVARILWVFPGSYFPHWFSKRFRKNQKRLPALPIHETAVIAWSGMRGIVSLAAALALPLTIGTEPFPNRDMIIFLTLCVIFVTLVMQGMTLRKVIEWLRVQPDYQSEKVEAGARLSIASSVIEHIEENYALTLHGQVLDQVKTKYEIRMQRMRKDQSEQRLTTEQIEEFQRIQLELVKRERQVVLRMRREGQINDEVLRKIEYELDLEEARLELESVE